MGVSIQGFPITWLCADIVPKSRQQKEKSKFYFLFPLFGLLDGLDLEIDQSARKTELN